MLTLTQLVGQSVALANGGGCGGHSRGFASVAYLGLGSLVVVPLLKGELLFLFDVGNHTQGVGEGFRDAGEIPLSIAASPADGRQNFFHNPILEPFSVGKIGAHDKTVNVAFGDDVIRLCPLRHIAVAEFIDFFAVSIHGIVGALIPKCLGNIRSHEPRFTVHIHHANLTKLLPLKNLNAFHVASSKKNAPHRVTLGRKVLRQGAKMNAICMCPALPRQVQGNAGMASCQSPPPPHQHPAASPAPCRRGCH